jgi:hypothetical protein
VRGKQQREGRYGFRGQQQPNGRQNGWQQGPPPVAGPGTQFQNGYNGGGQAPQWGPRSVPAGQFQLQPQHMFFSEGPTAPNPEGQMNGMLTQEEAFYAQKMGMTPEQYTGWRGGVVRR